MSRPTIGNTRCSITHSNKRLDSVGSILHSNSNTNCSKSSIFQPSSNFFVQSMLNSNRNKIMLDNYKNKSQQEQANSPSPDPTIQELKDKLTKYEKYYKIPPKSNEHSNYGYSSNQCSNRLLNMNNRSNSHQSLPIINNEKDYTKELICPKSNLNTLSNLYNPQIDYKELYNKKKAEKANKEFYDIKKAEIDFENLYYQQKGIINYEKMYMELKDRVDYQKFCKKIKARQNQGVNKINNDLMNIYDEMKEFQKNFRDRYKIIQERQYRQEQALNCLIRHPKLLKNIDDDTELLHFPSIFSNYNNSKNRIRVSTSVD